MPLNGPGRGEGRFVHLHRENLIGPKICRGRAHLFIGGQQQVPEPKGTVLDPRMGQIMSIWPPRAQILVHTRYPGILGSLHQGNVMKPIATQELKVQPLIQRSAMVLLKFCVASLPETFLHLLASHYSTSFYCFWMSKEL